MGQDFFEIGAGFGLDTLSFILYGLLVLVGIAWVSWVTVVAFNSYLETDKGRDEDFVSPVVKGWITFIAITIFYGAIIF